VAKTRSGHFMQIPTLIRSRFRFAGNLARAADVATVLAKYGLAGWLTDVEWAPGRESLKSQRGIVLAEQSFEVRVRLALTDLGTTYVKLGQVLSTRPHLVGPELAKELSKLQDKIPADPPDVAKHVVETELGRPIDECYKHFEGVALASASIGQVHDAKLKSGKRVVVKVQHPGIEGTIRRDLDILSFLADLAEKNETLRGYQPKGLIREFSRTLLNELDFRREVRNLQVFRRNFAEDETVEFPKPYPELCTGRVLTMERIQGHALTDKAALEKVPVSPEEIAVRGANVFLEMIFRDGFYHADPHPGNIMVMPDGKLALLDAGMVGRIDEGVQKQIADILMAAADRDSQRLTDAVLRVCGTPDNLDRNSLANDLTELFELYGTQTVGNMNVTGALDTITSILHEHKLILPGNISMLIKCLIELEGTSTLLNPNFNLAELLEPWRRRFIRHQFSPRTHLKELRRLYSDWERTAEAVPKAINTVIDRIDKRKFSINLELTFLKAAMNRLVVGLFVSALMISSALLIVHHIPPQIKNVSILGMLGYVVSILFGFRVIWHNRDSRVSKRRGSWE
jgi:ubiquinone biosynthesis protein